MTPQVWIRIDAVASRAQRVRSWATFMRQFGDTASAQRLDRRARRDEVAAERLARAAGAEKIVLGAAS